MLGASLINFVLTERMWELICITRSCSGLERFGLKTELKSCASIKVKKGAKINQPENCVGKDEAVTEFNNQIVVGMKNRVIPVP